MSTNAKLREIALKLPPYPDFNHHNQSCRRMISGSQLIAMGTHYVDTPDKKKRVAVDPNGYYTVELKFFPIDHFKHMKALHNAGGVAAVNQYMKKVKEFHRLTKEDTITQP